MKEFIKQNINMNIIIKIAKREELNTKIMGAIFNIQELKIIQYCLRCNRNCQKQLDENLKKTFANAYEFSKRDISKYILLLWTGIYPCKYMDD